MSDRGWLGRGRRLRRTGSRGPAHLRGKLCVLLLAGLLPGLGSAIELPLRNPYLADSVNPMAHGDPAQQDAVRVPGPADPGRRFAPDEIEYAATGPAHFGAFTSSPYPDGRRVNWSNGLDRIVKVDFDTFERLAERCRVARADQLRRSPDRSWPATTAGDRRGSSGPA